MPWNAKGRYATTIALPPSTELRTPDGAADIVSAGAIVVHTGPKHSYGMKLGAPSPEQAASLA
ncbi:MAG TPA: hypothetical protein VHS59_01205 [Bacillota bacterium]|nr:hypothetical protein [Bacillota bacterium]